MLQFDYDPDLPVHLSHTAANPIITDKPSGGPHDTTTSSTTSSPPSSHKSTNGTKPRATSFDLGPHPADPHSTVMPASPTKGPGSQFSLNGGGGMGRGVLEMGPRGRSESVPGQEIWCYGGAGGCVRSSPLCFPELCFRFPFAGGSGVSYPIVRRTDSFCLLGRSPSGGSSSRYRWPRRRWRSRIRLITGSIWSSSCPGGIRILDGRLIL